MGTYIDLVMKGPQHALNNFEIDRFCQNVENYKGCVPYDEIPKEFFNNNSKVNINCIANTKTFEEGGEHWVALIKLNGKTIIYDSFARESQKMRYPKEWIETNKNIEQDYDETNCGLRCIAFLYCCEKFSIEETIKII